MGHVRQFATPLPPGLYLLVPVHFLREVETHEVKRARAGR